MCFWGIFFACKELPSMETVHYKKEKIYFDKILEPCYSLFMQKMTKIQFQSGGSDIPMTLDRRQLIIEASTKSFSLFGYKATTMDQVSKLANVGKGTIYTFFKNKDELFSEIVSSMVKEMKSAADQAIQENRTFSENVHSALIRLLEFRTEHQLMLKLIQEEKEMGTHAVQEKLHYIEDELLAYVKSKIDIAMEKGQIQECDSEIVSFVLLKVYISLVSDWERKHEPLSSEKIATIMRKYLLNGLST